VRGSAAGARLPRLAYSADEVAAMLGVGRSTVFEWCRLGRVEAIRIGRVVRIPADALDALLARHRSERGLGS
jgi:excisionase family DNA binding protein